MKIIYSFLLLLTSIGIMAQDVTIDAAYATTIQNSLNAGTDFTVTATGNIIVNASILKNLGSSAALTLNATKSIVINAGSSITSTSNALNLVFWSRSGGNNAGDDGVSGCVWFQVGSSVISNGGNVVIGGGADPNLGYCVGDISYAVPAENNANYRGGAINGTLAAGGGNILIRGRASPSAGAARGVSIGGAISTTGSGTITITGQSIGGSDGLAFGDASVAGTTGTLTSGSGTISLTGIKATGSNGLNLAPFAGATAYINCGGNLTINSTGNVNTASAATYISCGGNLSVTSSGSINGVNGYITVTGTSSFSAGTTINLSNTNNDFSGTLSVSNGTDLTIVDKNALSLGTISISGLLSAKTLSGNLSVNNVITTTSTSKPAIKLYADYYKTAGDASGGNILVSGSPSIATGAGGSATLYTGSISGSTGLSGIASSSRYLSDYSTVLFYPSLGAGVYGIYREAGSLIWTGNSGTDWNTAGNWDLAVSPNPTFNTTVPVTANSPVVNQDVGSPAVCNNLLINSGAVLTIAAGKALTVNGTLSNNAGNTGLVINSNATGNGSLIHNTANVNASIRRYIAGSTSLADMVYHLVSVPLTAAASPTSNLFLGSYLYYFDETQEVPVDNGWVNMGIATTTPLTVTRGYMIYYPGASQIYSFAGPMNNGVFSAATSYTSDAAAGNKGFNLVPNPYPSAIDWLASTGWTKTNIDNAVYVWNSAVNTSNYASYINGASTNGGSRYIASGQAFFVHANAASPVLSMNNNVRLHNTVSFMKNSETIPNLLMIHADAGNASDELIVRFADGATSGFDSEWDAYKMTGGTNAPQIGSVTADYIDLAINSLPLIEAKVVVPLNFSFALNSEVTFTASGMESFDNKVSIYLEDMVLNKIINLRQEPVYIFNSSPGNPNDRFKLHFNDAIGFGETTASETGRAYASNGALYIEVPGMQGSSAEINCYNIIGQALSTCHVTMNGLVKIDAPQTGIFIVHVAASKKYFVTKVINK